MIYVNKCVYFKVYLLLFSQIIFKPATFHIQMNVFLIDIFKDTLKCTLYTKNTLERFFFFKKYTRAYFKKNTLERIFSLNFSKNTLERIFFKKYTRAYLSVFFHVFLSKLKRLKYASSVLFGEQKKTVSELKRLNKL